MQLQASGSQGKTTSLATATPPGQRANYKTSVGLPVLLADIQPDKNGKDDRASSLAVRDLDMLAEENGSEHHTSLYAAVQSGIAVLRRGFAFRLKLTLNREYDPEKDVICLIFTLKGEYKDTLIVDDLFGVTNPTYSNNGLVVVPILSKENDTQGQDWRCEIEDIKEEKTLLLSVWTAPTTLVGEWKIEVESRLKDEFQTRTYRYSDPIYILFNAWNSEDSVYMDNEEDLKEYVLNETGMLWRGSHSRLRPFIWNYGQMEAGVLEASVMLFTDPRFKFKFSSRGDPVEMVRHLSAVVNSPDDDGVIVGNWSGDFKKGTAPTDWIGSRAILEQFRKTGKPVKFGQCWVFAGICATVCRALGIPSRCVSNFASAHDTHNSLTVDYFFDSDGEAIERLNVDSIWNFHVWTEAWMQRPDLEPGNYAGWQAFDATPQELSDGMYRCGPASVAAIKRGEIAKPFDTQFLLAEVNADKVYWSYRDEYSPLKLLYTTTGAIGQFISTKAVGKLEREDITHTYKHTEGKIYKYTEESEEERQVMFKAMKESANRYTRYYLNEVMEDVRFDLQLIDDVPIGMPFTVSTSHVRLKVENRSAAVPHVVRGIIRVHSMFYTGKISQLVKKHSFNFELPPASAESVEVPIAYEEYGRKLVDHCLFNAAVLARVLDSDHEFFSQDDFRVRMPDITMKVGQSDF
ncbi:F13A1 [Cordylochernes scorpioides]|uniref:F13A1 n=1 Tax=Cordylochernes scorpioides TaxID=51811 RepID=A0ABY6LYK6_9ARAC|nr:F13A1 [Cordylochernes scorpioides]